MGIVVEYAGHKGKAQWIEPAPYHWNYTQFAKPGASASPPDETFEMTFAKDNAARARLQPLDDQRRRLSHDRRNNIRLHFT